LFDRIIPGIELPEVPGENLQAIDNQLRDWDAALVEFRTRLNDVESPITNIIEAISAAATRMGDAIERAATAVVNMQAKLLDIRASVAKVQATTQGWVTWGAVGLTLFFIYFLVGNMALFALGRIWRAKPAAATPLPATTQVSTATPVQAAAPAQTATPLPVPMPVAADVEGEEVADEIVAGDTVEGEEVTGDVVADEMETGNDSEAGLTRPI
jgi:hypothetical protein